jgi:hypothetical protein
LIVNGGFEQPGVPDGSWARFDQAFAGWRFLPNGSGDVDIARRLPSGTGPWLPFEGAQLLDITGCRPGAIRQWIATTPGRLYRLSLWVAPHPEQTNPVAADIKVGSDAGDSDLGLINVRFSTPSDRPGKDHRLRRPIRSVVGDAGGN